MTLLPNKWRLHPEVTQINESLPHVIQLEVVKYLSNLNNPGLFQGTIVVFLATVGIKPITL